MDTKQTAESLARRTERAAALIGCIAETIAYTEERAPNERPDLVAALEGVREFLETDPGI
jgi:hypothetical protein